MFHANPSSESQAWEFRHQEFRKGHISALQNIRRKNSKHQSPSNPINMKGGLSNPGPGQSLTSDIAAERDERIDSLTNQMAELMDRMRQMTENYSLLYAETVSCRMQQSKHEKVITDIANFLSSILREEDANDPRSLKRKFDVDCIQAEVAKFGQGDAQPPSHLPPTQQHPSHYPREGIQPARTISTNPQPMSGVESTSSIHHSSRMSDVDYRSATSPSFSGSQPLHRSPAKIPTSSPLSILPEFPFSSPHMQLNTNYLRHRSPEPITSVGSSGSVSRSSSMDTYKSASVPTSNSHSTQSSSQYAHSSPHRATHPPPHMPMSTSQHRRSSQPTSLGFGSDSDLLNPGGNRYKDNSSSPIPQPQPQRPSSSPSASSSPTYNKTDNPATANPTTSQSRPPPLPEPPDNEIEYKRRKRN